jgi:hypothetical protein
MRLDPDERFVASAGRRELGETERTHVGLER